MVRGSGGGKARRWRAAAARSSCWRAWTALERAPRAASWWTRCAPKATAPSCCASLKDQLKLASCSAHTWRRRARPLMKEKLSQGITLVVDRYAFSGVAFTSAKELQLAEAAARGEFGRERYESGPFQQRALQRFQQLLADPSLPWKTVNASRSIEEVHREIRALSEDAIRAAAHRPLGQLWA
ncbi:PREDICTED: thymidylate kinase isoform X4 [Capra hircus]|uniref:thymidylate kinase isoform X4 n=1 Tax=Capra hircus TaxID=9925 RepID=UPI00084730B7|nr:PREDICTED: thymidylate kinase isoform X4 [Capra hircus]